MGGCGRWGGVRVDRLHASLEWAEQRHTGNREKLSQHFEASQQFEIFSKSCANKKEEEGGRGGGGGVWKKSANDDRKKLHQGTWGGGGGSSCRRQQRPHTDSIITRTCVSECVPDSPTEAAALASHHLHYQHHGPFHVASSNQTIQTPPSDRSDSGRLTSKK